MDLRWPVAPEEVREAHYLAPFNGTQAHAHTHTGRVLKLIAEVQIEMVRNAIISHQIWPVDGSSGRLRDGSSIFGDTPRLANLFSFPMDPAVDIHRRWGSNKGRSFRSNVTSIDSLYFLAR